MSLARPGQRLRRWGLTTFAIGLFCLAFAARADGPGRELAQRVYDRADGDDVAMTGRMILTEKGFEPRERQMYTYGRDTDAGDFWSLIRFTTPVNVQDTGLLSQELADGSEAQWLYLPALKKVRRISAGRKGGRFVGSDLYYEDLQDRKVDKDEHRIVGEEAVAGKRCTILESVPVDPSNSVYSKRVSWIDPETLLAYRVDLYEKEASEPTKRLLVNVDRVQKVQEYWTILESTMTHLPSGHQTQILVDAIKYDQGVPDDLFSRKALEDPRLEVRYRP